MRAPFWFAVGIIAYVYFGYPLLLKLNFLGRFRAWHRGTARPLVSVIIPAHNEESVIAAKIENLLSSDYPREQIEILIGSDGSSDATEGIVQRYSNDGVGLLSFPQHQGKSAIQNGLVAASSGDILIFTDADCMLPSGALSYLVEHFDDERIGLVTGSPRYQNCDETNVTQNESRYLRYETWLRAQESNRGLLTVASGSLFALRRSLWKPLDPTWSDDFALPLQVALAGMRNVLDSRVVPVTRLTQNLPGSMFNLKVRIVSKDLRTVLAHRRLLNIFRYRGIAVGLWSHKLLRWLVPYFLAVTLASSVFLCRTTFFLGVLILQMILYGAALAGFLQRRGAAGFLLYIPMAFCVVNFAALLGTARCLLGQTSGKWKPVRRRPETVS
jgi:cellulose synthase/poly-beta-1,6-N-acetylglucosamine synthase-like glycosyltransferase